MLNMTEKPTIEHLIVQELEKSLIPMSVAELGCKLGKDHSIISPRVKYLLSEKKIQYQEGLGKEGYYNVDNRLNFCKWFCQRPQIDNENNKLFLAHVEAKYDYPRTIIKSVNDLQYFENNVFYKLLIGNKSEIKEKWLTIKNLMEIFIQNGDKDKELKNKLNIAFSNFYKRLKIYNC